MAFNHSRRALFLRPFSQPDQTTEQAYLPLRPPWSLEDSDFLEQCIRCNQCADACEENIIKLADGGYPELDFSKGECTFCEACVNACESQFNQALTQGTGTVKSPALSKHQGLSAFYFDLSIDESCLSKQKIACQSCQEVCDSESISMKWLTSIPVPELSLEDCTGCGACVSVCPSSSFKMSALTSPNRLGN
jgi:ferredoxin-type protein NapF